MMTTGESTITIQSSRFGALSIAPEEAIEFPHGLIGLAGSRYALLQRNPGSGFLWLHSLQDGALALPVIDPRPFFPGFELVLSAEERERIGDCDPGAAAVYVTVRAAADPAETVANLRAPLLICAGVGFQVLNGAPGADLQAPLFPSRRPAGDAA